MAHPLNGVDVSKEAMSDSEFWARVEQSIKMASPEARSPLDQLRHETAKARANSAHVLHEQLGRSIDALLKAASAHSDGAEDTHRALGRSEAYRQIAAIARQAGPMPSNAKDRQEWARKAWSSRPEAEAEVRAAIGAAKYLRAE